MPEEEKPEVQLEEFEQPTSDKQAIDKEEIVWDEAINSVPVRITAVVGEKSIAVRDLVKLGRGAVIPLGRKVGSPIDIYANDRMIARGEITVIEDDQIAVTMTEMIRTSQSHDD